MEVEESRRKERSPPSSSTPLAMRTGSHHPISKPKKHKIRIIHIFAPEIIKTDVANFRELVQRLTGKPEIRHNSMRRDRPHHQHHHRRHSHGHREFSSTARRLLVKEEDDGVDGQMICLGSGGSDDQTSQNFSPSSSSSGGGGGSFLGAFADLEHDFVQQLGGDFTLLPCLDDSSSLSEFQAIG